MNHASRVWAVSREMADFYPVKDIAKVKVLFPAPEGVNAIGSFASWKDSFKSCPVLAFAGSYHSLYAPFLRMAAEALLKGGGEAVIMSKKLDFIQKEIGDYKNIRYLNSLPNVEALAFLRNNVSAVLIPGSIDTGAAGWQLSFPSRLVEFVHTGLPVVISGIPGTALANWAEKRQWLGYAAAGDHDGLNRILEKLKDREVWSAMAAQSRAAALGEFSTERIQTQFESELAFKRS